MYNNKLHSLLIFSLVFLFISCKQKEKRETKYENGQVKEQYEVVKTENDSYIKEGSYVVFYQNGQKKEEALYEDNKLNGAFKQWYEDGKIRTEGTYKGDSLDGTYKMYNKNGELEAVFLFTNAKVNGEAVVYDKGKLIIKGNYQDNKAQGTWVLYNQNGEQIGKAEMIDGTYKTPVQSVAHKTEQSPGASFLGFALNQTTYPEVKLGFLDKAYFPETTAVQNEFTGGKMIRFTGNNIGMEELKEGTFIFDKNDRLVALTLTMPKGKSSKYGRGRMANFHAMRNALAKNYKLISEEIPFVGNSSAKFSGNNSFILIDSPHLDFDMRIHYWLDGYAEAITSLEGND